jgi:hypothetical protein
MFQTTDAIYDGHSLLPDDPLRLEPNTRVRLTIEVLPEHNGVPATAEDMPLTAMQAAEQLMLPGKQSIPELKYREDGTVSFLETLASMKLDGPSDWSENVDKYLYGDPPKS